MQKITYRIQKWIKETDGPWSYAKGIPSDVTLDGDFDLEGLVESLSIGDLLILLYRRLCDIINK